MLCVAVQERHEVGLGLNNIRSTRGRMETPVSNQIIARAFSEDFFLGSLVKLQTRHAVIPLLRRLNFSSLRSQCLDTELGQIFSFSSPTNSSSVT